ncbi:BBE domain-containing protein [Streptomyces sp. NPDC094031]|uniref:BBE domain-containing protein n=1 Tax=Streptomyces sp. NPDC094031 TaxID=3155307 RepID=UPI00331F8E49
MRSPSIRRPCAGCASSRSPGPPGVGGGSRAFRGNCDRPAAVKRACDPDDFFRVNQNIPPA